MKLQMQLWTGVPQAEEPLAAQWCTTESGRQEEGIIGLGHSATSPCVYLKGSNAEEG